jgi:hypothetical protein
MFREVDGSILNAQDLTRWPLVHEIRIMESQRLKPKSFGMGIGDTVHITLGLHTSQSVISPFDLSNIPLFVPNCSFMIYFSQLLILLDKFVDLRSIIIRRGSYGRSGGSLLMHKFRRHGF